MYDWLLDDVWLVTVTDDEWLVTVTRWCMTGYCDYMMYDWLLWLHDVTGYCDYWCMTGYYDYMMYDWLLVTVTGYDVWLVTVTRWCMTGYCD